MKVPKYIENALKQREKAAAKWLNADWIISDFILKNMLEDDVDSADYATGVEGLCNAEDSSERILKAIRNK